MELSSRIDLMNWLVNQGLTGLPEPDLIRGFCERCRAGGLDLSRGLAFIDTLHPIYEGRGFRWNDRPSNESDTFEYMSSADGDAACHGDLVGAIERGDLARLTAIPGIGKKTSERIVLELRDRLPRPPVA